MVLIDVSLKSIWTYIRIIYKQHMKYLLWIDPEENNSTNDTSTMLSKIRQSQVRKVRLS